MKKSNEELYNICKEFFNPDNIVEIKELTGGHINETYEIDFKDCRYVLQKLNSHVFQSPIGVMNNTRLITDHIRKKIVYNGKDPRRAVINIVKTKYDQDVALVGDEYWRCVEFIEGSVGYSKVESPAVFYQMGRAVGDFQNMLSDFHSRLIDDPIKHFHDTQYRYANFLNVIKLNPNKRNKECEKEIDFIKRRSTDFGIITDKINNKSIPRRVTHNDTKSSNIMLDEKTGEFLCMIDLDTVMRGSLVFDYGDALRFGASIALEDEVDLSKVKIDLQLIKAFTKGFLQELKSPYMKTDDARIKRITKEEIALLYDGYRIITIELAMRFLIDYLEGDHYFNCDPSRPKHNLERARNQIKVVKEIEANEKNIKNIINECLNDLEYDKDFFVEI